MNDRQQRALNRMACLLYATAMQSAVELVPDFVVVPWAGLPDAQRDEWRQRVLLAIRGRFGPIMAAHGPDSSPAAPTPS